VVIIISQELAPVYDWFHSKFDLKGKFLFRAFQVARTMFIVSSLRILDCYRDVPLSFRQFGTMFTKWNISELWNGSLLKLGLTGADYLVLVLGVALMLIVSLLQRGGSLRDQIYSRPAMLRYVLTIAAVLILMTVGAYGIGYDSRQFIYNQF